MDDARMAFDAMMFAGDPARGEFAYTALMEEAREAREAGCPTCSGCGELITYGEVYKVGSLIVCENCYDFAEHMSIEDYKGGIYEF